MNHFAAEAQLDINIDKPFYKIDYRLNSEIYVPETGDCVPSKLDSYYKLKRFTSGKLGLKYYAWNTKICQNTMYRLALISVVIQDKSTIVNLALVIHILLNK